MFPSTPINASAGCRVRESRIQLYVAGRLVNVLLASSGCAPPCTRPPAPGAFLVLLWFLLPATPVLSTFGFPKTVEDIHSAERLLDYLQRYNRALVRTTEVLHWFIFVFVWWFLAALYSLTKVFGGVTNVRSHQSITKPEA